MTLPQFVQKFEEEAKTFLDNGKVKEIIFSENTYEVEVEDNNETKSNLWPFLQIDDEGKVIDYFCTCQGAEDNKGCVHLAAAYLRICHKDNLPLHIHLHSSLWHCLCQLASRRIGYDSKVLIKKNEGSYCFISKTKKEIFSVEGLTPVGIDNIKEIIEKKELETEETSLKFSNLSLEDIALWRKGKASHHLLYELSFWSDLSKWLFLLQDNKQPYKISFSQSSSVFPSEINISFSEVNLNFYISEANWPDVIPTLSTVESPLKVYDFEEKMIDSIIYDEEKNGFSIHLKKTLSEYKKNYNEYPKIGSCFYIANEGFYCYCPDPLFEKSFIPKENISSILNKYTNTFKKFLKNTQIYEEPITPHYNLFFDQEDNFHIECYLFEITDLDQKKSCYFGQWVYLQNKGFYKLNETNFVDKHTVIKKEKVSDFIGHHRVWLQQYEGFKSNFGNIQSQLFYSFDGENLCFDSSLDMPQGLENYLDFGVWIYIHGKGFFMKKSSKSLLPLHPGLCVSKEKISSFIESHIEELEQLQGFFTNLDPINKVGLNIFLDDKLQVVIKPLVILNDNFRDEDLIFLDNYIYIKEKGFYSLLSSHILPKKYAKETIISKKNEAYFLKYELATLKKFAIDIDKRLNFPKKGLTLCIKSISKEKKRGTRYFLLNIVYKSEFGEVKAYDIYKGLDNKQKYIFSSAGLIDLQDVRFNWISHLNKNRIHRTNHFIRLNTLEWIRLGLSEKIEWLATESKETRKLLQELESFSSSKKFCLDLLNAQLRPYQETGLQWLWFLYCHELSGLLCDEMGLGKTHQAMALMACANYEDERKTNKYLVVCPTSVIYHWQESLEKFLPDVKVCVFHGYPRDLSEFDEKYQVLLTSYGILRLEKDKISEFDFEIAIYDEIQIAKNYISKTHKALKLVPAKMRLGLTGTPIENYLQELKALFDVILPNYLPSVQMFREFFTVPIEKKFDEGRKRLLSSLIKPFILRRKKSEVLLDLPEKIEEIAHCDLSLEQKQLYNETLNLTKRKVMDQLKEKNKPIPYAHVFAIMGKLKQICDHPSLIYKDIDNFQSHESGKWDLFVELLNEARESSQKVVIFSQYLNMLAIIEKYLKKKSIGYAVIKGSTKNRAEEIRRFHQDPKCEVFVASLLAAGLGINLSAGSVVIHYDRWWNAAKEDQATDRVHRIGQSRGVQVFKLVTKNTLEERIHQLIQRKRSLVEDTIGVDDSESIKRLTREEIIAALQEIPIE